MLNLVALGHGLLGVETSGRAGTLAASHSASCGLRSRSENRKFSQALHFPSASDGDIDLGVNALTVLKSPFSETHPKTQRPFACSIPSHASWPSAALRKAAATARAELISGGNQEPKLCQAEGAN